MRLLSLYISEYQVLNQLRIDFDQLGRIQSPNRPYHLDFLVGVNGSGKSTVLRVLGEIFRYLGSDTQKINFGFDLEYWHEIRQERVRVTNIDLNTGDLVETKVFVANSLNAPFDFDDPKELVWIQTPNNDGIKLLPSRVVAYTTGAESDWEPSRTQSLFELSDPEVLQKASIKEHALHELPVNQRQKPELEKSSATFFRLIPKKDLPTIALCGLLVNAAQTEEVNQPLNQVLQETKIQNFPGFSLCFDLTDATYRQRQEIYTRLAGHATRKIRNGSEVKLVFNLMNFARKLKEEFGSGLELYEFLAGLATPSKQLRPVLKEVAIFIERTKENEKTPPLHTWEWLSDGERSFLGRMCLFLLFGDADTLILLDEPEVHFNDYWKRHIVGLLHNIMTQKETRSQFTCHLLIATHSSIALTDVHRDDIILLVREGLKTTGTSHTPSFQTFGADPSDIMVHVFGTKFANGERSVSYIRERIAQSTREELVKLQSEVAPGYWHYRIQLEINQFGEVQVL